MNKDIATLREVVVKLTQLLAGQGLRVTQEGTQAAVFPDANGKPIRVNLPFLPDDASDDLVVAVQGFLDHEVAHILFTDFNHKKVERHKDNRLHVMHNIVEDTYIERAMARKFSGSGYNLTRTQEFFLDKIIKPALVSSKCKNDKDKARLLMVPMFRALSGQIVFQRFMDENKYWDVPLIKAFVDKFGPKNIDLLKKADCTADTYVLAEIAHGILYPPPPPPKPAPKTKPSKEKNEEKSDGESDEKSDDSDGEGSNENKPEDEDDKGAGGESEAKPESDDEEEGDGATPEKDKGEPDEDDKTGDPADGEQDGDGEKSEGDDADGDGDEAAPADDAGDGDEDEDNPVVEEDGDDGDGAPEADDSDEPAGDAGGSSDGADQEDSGDEESGSKGGDEAGAGDDGAGEEEQGDGAGGVGDEENEEETEGDDENGDATPGQGSSPFSETEIDLEGLNLEDAIQSVIADMAARQTRDADYRIFSKDYDKIETYKVDDEIYKDHWLISLDDKVQHMIGPMQKDIERMMASRSKVTQVPGFRSGRLHGAGLHKLLVKDDRVFRRRQENKSKSTAVFLLIDNSGSMSGNPMTTAMQTGYALSQTLERVGIANEVVGFTTDHYSKTFPRAKVADEAAKVGGYARCLPLYLPIYKSFDERLTSPVKKRFAAAIHCQNFLGNNVDGESVQYATKRLAQRTEERKVLIVLSDGNPAMDPSAYNPTLISAGFSHLHTAIAEATRKKVEVIGVGIDDDSVRAFYKRCVVIRNVEELPGFIMGELKRIIMTP
jgi:cobalamin biosynthesis protein CobT